MGVDAHSILGVAPGASLDEITAAYRRLAKEWHPDVHGTESAVRRMVAINAAYEELRSRGASASGRTSPSSPSKKGGTARGFGPLGPELSAALGADEAVVAYGRASTWDSPEAFLVLTSLRLLWLLDDAVTHRVRSLSRNQVRSVDVLARRRHATLRIESRRGRRFEFAEMTPAVASAIESALSPGSAAEH
jgi:DnaJ domain